MLVVAGAVDAVGRLDGGEVLLPRPLEELAEAELVERVVAVGGEVVVEEAGVDVDVLEGGGAGGGGARGGGGVELHGDDGRLLDAVGDEEAALLGVFRRARHVHGEVEELFFATSLVGVLSLPRIIDISNYATQ